MLKRQRQVSPPPSSSSSVPLVSDDPPKHKRQRILPPVLDGQVRGRVWELEDDGEEDDYDSVVKPQWQDASSEYKSANSVLHDLHALHRHRMIFTNPSFNLPSHDAPAGKGPVAPTYYSSSPSSKFESPNATHAHEQSPSFTEEQLVKERYEDTNRLLRSVFLSRRKNTDR